METLADDPLSQSLPAHQFKSAFKTANKRGEGGGRGDGGESSAAAITCVYDERIFTDPDEEAYFEIMKNMENQSKVSAACTVFFFSFCIATSQSEYST